MGRPGGDEHIPQPADGQGAGQDGQMPRLQHLQDVLGIAKGGAAKLQYRLLRRIPQKAGVGVGQHKVDGGNDRTPGRGAPHAVPPDEGIEQAFVEPIPEVGDKIFPIHRPALGLGQVHAPAGQHPHDDPGDGHPFRPEDGLQLFQPVAVVQKIVHQQHRPLEGFQGAGLVGQGGIARGFQNGKAAQIRGKYLFRMEGLGDRMGNHIPGKHLHIGHAHIGPHPIVAGRHRVPALDLFHQSLVEQLRIKAKEQAAGEYILFVDADDYVECGMIEEMVNAAETNHAEMVICGYDQEHSGVIVKHEYKYDAGVYVGEGARKIAIDLISDVSAKRIPPYSPVRMILKDVLENPQIRYAKGMIRSEDYYFFVQLHFRIKRLYLLGDKPLYQYIEVSNSVTHRYVPKYWSSVKKIYHGLLEKLPEDEGIKRRLGVMLVQRSLIALNNVSRKKSKDMFRKELYEIILDEDLNYVIFKMNTISYLKSYIWLMSNHVYLIIYWRYLLKFYRNKIFL